MLEDKIGHVIGNYKGTQGDMQRSYYYLFTRKMWEGEGHKEEWKKSEGRKNKSWKWWGKEPNKERKKRGLLGKENAPHGWNKTLYRCQPWKILSTQNIVHG